MNDVVVIKTRISSSDFLCMDVAEKPPSVTRFNPVIKLPAFADFST
jgi:hypothetical protein